MVAQLRDLALVQHRIVVNEHHATHVGQLRAVQQDVPQTRHDDVLDELGVVVAQHDDLLAQLTAVGERGGRNHHGDAEDALQHDLRRTHDLLLALEPSRVLVVRRSATAIGHGILHFIDCPNDSGSTNIIAYF